jgi:peroxiredoxin
MLKQSSDTLNIGDRAPDFALPTADRQTVRLSQFRGGRVVVVFIRGTW